MMTIRHLILFAQLFCIYGFLINDGTVKVQTPVGEIIGILHNIQFDGKHYQVKEFLGIPYAEPPVGNNRFRKPVPKANFARSFNASDFGPRCIQGPSPMTPAAVTIPMSEDCLYLNIFAPAVLGSMTQRLPVMLWIHGGGFVVDSNHLYIGDVLSNFGEVIVVAINYRLNYLGFLNTNEGSGNFGLWDQHLAIKWVHDNIASFGGDTSKVTVFGESAGSTSVMYQALYPGNKGLFQRAIAESGGLSSPWGFAYNESAQTTFARFTSSLGCKGTNAEIMTCMRSKPSHEIVELLNKEPTNFVVVPHVDGEFVKKSPSDMFVPATDIKDAHAFFHEIDLLMGGNSIDGGLVMPMWLSSFGVTNPELLRIPRFLYHILLIPTTLKTLYPNIPHIPSSAINATIYEYTNWTAPNDDMARNRMAVKMATDYAVFAPMVSSVQAHALNSTGSTYMYKFSTRPDTHLLPTPSWLDGPTQANHADEIAFVFGFSDRRNVQYQKMGVTFNVTDQDIQVSKAVMTMWTNFAKSG